MRSATVWQAGYTIVEVMIFLIISGVLLIGAFGLFNGRIQRTQFSQAVQEVASRIQNTANEAATGTYPDSPPFSCKVTVGSGPAFSVVAGAQGTRSDCVFAGKVINLAVSGAGTGCTPPINASTCDKAEVYTAVGRRTTDGTTSVTVLNGPTGALPALVVGTPDLTQTYSYTNSVHVTGVYQENGPLTPISGMGFFQSFGGNYTNGNLTSGSQNVQLWLVKAATNPVNPQTAANEDGIIKADSVGTPTLIGPNPNPGVLICLSGGSNQTAAIRINPAVSGMNAVVTMDDPKC